MSKGEGSDRTILRKEIGIALFWRGRIGDYEYVKFDPDDVLRWHLALEMRGPNEVADLMAERYKVYARKTPILGLVAQAPHPPAWIVHEWLTAQQPKFPGWRAVAAGAAFLIFAGIAVPNLHGCQNIRSSDKLAYQPPNSQPPPGPASPSGNVEVQPAIGMIFTPGFTTSGPLMIGGATPPGAPSASGGVAPPSSASTSVHTTPTNSGISSGGPP